MDAIPATRVPAAWAGYREAAPAVTVAVTRTPLRGRDEELASIG